VAREGAAKAPPEGSLVETPPITKLVIEISAITPPAQEAEKRARGAMRLVTTLQRTRHPRHGGGEDIAVIGRLGWVKAATMGR